MALGSHYAAALGLGNDATESTAQTMAVGAGAAPRQPPELHPHAQQSRMGAALPGLGETEG